MFPSFYLFKVIGSDTTPPVVTFCPENIVQDTAIGSTSAIVTWEEPRAMDNSGIPPVVTRTHESGTRFDVGETRVTYTFTDESSNRNTCSFLVTVRVGKYLETLSINTCFSF